LSDLHELILRAQQAQARRHARERRLSYSAHVADDARDREHARTRADLERFHGAERDVLLTLVETFDGVRLDDEVIR
jgi:hypothetical protein